MVRTTNLRRMRKKIYMYENYGTRMARIAPIFTDYFLFLSVLICIIRSIRVLFLVAASPPYDFRFTIYNFILLITIVSLILIRAGGAVRGADPAHVLTSPIQEAKAC